MRDFVSLFIHLIVTVVRLALPGGLRSVVAESVLLRHQLHILNRSRKRAPNLRATERIIGGLCTLFMNPARVLRSAIVLKPSTLLHLHQVLAKRKYRMLFSPKHRRQPGPKGPNKELIQAVVELKRRNPNWGCPRIAQQIMLAMPAMKDRAVVEAKVAVVKVLVQLIQVLHEGIEGLNRQIQEAAEAHPDFFIFESLPGVGTVMAPRLLAAFGSQRERYQNAAEVQTLSGIAPVTESSGKSSWVHFRFACPKFLRQSFREWASYSITQSQWARAYYELQCRRGKKHHAAVRALAFKWIRIIFRCWKERVAYDENVYLAALAKHNSTLLAATKIAW